jgi:predicted metal-dependent phosphoesterase TrpH
MKWVKCRFQETSSLYSFLCPVDDVTIGDLFLADTSRGIRIVEIVEISMMSDSKATKFVFQRIDTSLLDALRETAARRVDIKNKLTDKLRAQEANERFSALAAVDPEAAGLLAELKTLENMGIARIK